MSLLEMLQAGIEPYKLQVCLLIFVLVVISYVLNKISMAKTAMLGFFALVITGIVTPKDSLTYIGNSTVLMCCGMLVVAAAFQRTAFCTRLAEGVAKVAQGKLLYILLGYCILAMLLAQFIQAPLAAFSICAPLLIASVEVLGYEPSKVIFPMGVVAISTCCTLPFGAGATQAAQLNALMESYGYTDYLCKFTDVALGRFPVLIMSIIYAVFIGVKLAPDKCSVPSAFVKSDPKTVTPLKPYQEVAGIVVFFGTSAALMVNNKLGLPTWVVTCVGALLVSLFKILDTKSTVNAMGIPMALVIAGSLCLAGALSSTGAGEMIGGMVSAMADKVEGNSYVIGMVFFLVPFIMTQFMLNMATMMIFHPIALAAAQSLGGDPRGLMIIIQAACLAAFMTPMANGTVPFIMSYGGYTQKELIKQGLPIGLLIGVVSVLWIMTVFPLMH